MKNKQPIFRFEFKGHRKRELTSYKPLKYKIIQVMSGEDEGEALEKLEEKYTVIEMFNVENA